MLQLTHRFPFLGFGNISVSRSPLNESEFSESRIRLHIIDIARPNHIAIPL